MKLTTFLIIITLLHVSGKGLAQITIHVRNGNLPVVLQKIEQQSGYVFIYNNQIIFEKISVDLINAPINDVLKACFSHTDLTYQIVDKNVIIQKKAGVPLPEIKPVTSNALPELVIGQVTNIRGEPLEGATVLVKRTNKGTTTDLKGRYIIKTAELTDTLVFKYIGYKSQQIPVKNKNTAVLDVVLLETTNSLDEVVVAAYGQTTQRMATGDISVVTAKDIEKQPVMDPMLALQGKVPGLVVTPESGYEGGPLKVEIRGRKAINSNLTSDPLYIIDGVPLTVLDAAGTWQSTPGAGAVSRGLDQTGLSYAGGQNALFSLNPRDIESISVLKDADATAIYGSRGANGVILITTKHGKSGDDQFGIGLDRGVNFVTRYFPQLNTQQYLEARREEFNNDGITPTITNAADLLLWSPTRYTDWSKYFFGKSTNYTNLNARLSGGSDQTTYSFSGGYGNSTDVGLAGGQNYRGTFAFNVDHRSKNQKFSVGFSGNYGFTVLNEASLVGLTTLPPNAPPVYDSKGNLNFAEWDEAKAVNFPFGTLKDPYSAKGNFLTAHMGLNYNIVKGLKGSVSLGYNTTTNTANTINPIAGQDPTKTPAALTASSTFGVSRVTNWIVEPELSYNTLISKGKFMVQLGGTLQDNSTDGQTVYGIGYTSDVFIKSISLAPTVLAKDNYLEYKYAGVYLHMNYTWDEKYVLNLNGRRDGSSRFGPGSQFGNFGSVGTAWLLDQEKWVKAALPKFISSLKLQASYGITGSDAIGDYAYLSQYGNTSPQLPPYGGLTSLNPQIQPNQNFHWQVNKQFQTSLNLGLFDDHVTLNTAWYQSRCNNQLLNFPTPLFTGFSTVVANSPADVQNTGLEFALATNIKNGDFSSNFGLNFGFNHNKLLSYPNLAQSPYAKILRIGGNIQDTYVLNFAGVDPLTGNYTFTDYNHNGKIDLAGGVAGTLGSDTYIAENLNPKFSIGTSPSFTYKNFNLSFVITIVKQTGRELLMGGNNMTNMPLVLFQDRWQYPGQIATFGKLTSTLNINGYNPIDLLSSSNFGYTDASYIRLNNVSASYSLPEKFCKVIGVKGLSVSMSAQRLLTLTKYKGIDPELQNQYGAQPLKQTITAGLNCSF